MNQIDYDCGVLGALFYIEARRLINTLLGFKRETKKIGIIPMRT